MAYVRPAGAPTDSLALTSDAGTLTVLVWDAAAGSWRRGCAEIFGKTGIRRAVPGEYLAIDPVGRAAMVAAVQRSRFVYKIGRDSAGELSLESPLEAHKPGTLCLDIAALDVGYENPRFVALELAIGEADEDHTGAAAAQAEKQLVTYELDSGLNHVVRKGAVVTQRSAHAVLAMPSGEFGPGGTLVLAQGWVLWHGPDGELLHTAIPTRELQADDAAVMIACGTVLPGAAGTFTLLQSEEGDCFSVQLVRDEAGAVVDLTVAYFDSLPPAVSLALSPLGVLCTVSEAGEHYMHRLESLEAAEQTTSHAVRADAAEVASVKFQPGALTHWSRIHTLPSMAPLTRLIPLPARSGSALASGGAASDMNFLALCGRGCRSSARLVRHGLPVTDLATSETPGVASSIHVLQSMDAKLDPDTAAAKGIALTPGRVAMDKFILLSFSSSTHVLTLGEDVSETSATPFATHVPTLAAIRLHNGTYLQITPAALRIVQFQADGEYDPAAATKVEWKPPGGAGIAAASLNTRQAAVLLSTGAVVYFECDSSGQLQEQTTFGGAESGTQFTSVALGAVPAGRLRSPWLATAVDDQVRMYSTADQAFDSPAHVASAPAHVHSMALLVVPPGKRTGAAAAGVYLYLGLTTGLLQRWKVDAVSGRMAEPSGRVAGGRPVRVRAVAVHGNVGVLANSSKSWLCWHDEGTAHVVPLAYEALTDGVDLCADIFTSGLVTLCGNAMGIVSVNTAAGQVATTARAALHATPRGAALITELAAAVVIEADSNAYPEAELRAAGIGAGQDAEADQDPDEVWASAGHVPRVGVPRPDEPAAWSSSVRLLGYHTGQAVSQHALEHGEGALCVARVPFLEAGPGEYHVVVGAAKGLTWHPAKHQGGVLHLFLVTAEQELRLLHSTDIEAPPMCAIAYKGRLAVSIGTSVRLYGMGKHRLLRKGEVKALPSPARAMLAVNDRLVVGTAEHSVLWLEHQPSRNTFAIVAGDAVPRHVVSLAPLDPCTVAVGDRWGTVAVLRLPAETLQAGASGTRSAVTPYPLAKLEAAVHVGDMPMALCPITLPSGRPSVLIGTLGGGLKLLSPLISSVEAGQLEKLQWQVLERRLDASLVKRDPAAFRAYWEPSTGVIDGELLDAVAAGYAGSARLQDMAQAGGSTVAELQRLLDQVHTSLL